MIQAVTSLLGVLLPPGGDCGKTFETAGQVSSPELWKSIYENLFWHILIYKRLVIVNFEFGEKSSEILMVVTHTMKTIL